MMAAQLQQAGEAASSQTAGQTSGLGAAATTPEAHAPTPKVSKPLLNRTTESKSPYVLAQKDTLVNWQLLDNEAIELAKSENKPIFLHIGFLACHYCHMTTRDSFSNTEIASYLNENFIPIIVDREERPDIDYIYWNYLQLVNSSAGWPINVFLTPELEPVFGGTYWPGPGSEDSVHGGDGEDFIGFLGILQKLHQSWTEKEAKCREEAKETVVLLGKFVAEGTLGPRGLLRENESSDVPHLSAALDLDIDLLDEAYTKLKKTFDPVNGGFGVVPKFVTPAKYSFLLQLGDMPSVVQDMIGEAEVANAVQMSLYTLRKLRDSALNDHIGGGFARASHTINWTLPHFEKLIPDNGLLLSLYLDAWMHVLQHPGAEGADEGGKKGTRNEFLDVVYSLANYLSSKPVQLDNGGFASSEAADSLNRKGAQHTRDGAYYLWARREFDTVIAGPNNENDQEARVAANYWNVLQHGNVDQEDDPDDEFINQNVLYVVKDESELAKQFGITPDDIPKMLVSARKKLAAHREKERVRPPIDEKVTVSGNGIVIGALSRTGATLKYGGFDVENGNKYILAAESGARFIQKNLWDEKKQVLHRTYSAGHAEEQTGFAEDYTFLVEGLLELYEATGNVEWLQWADNLQKIQIELFYDKPNATPTSTHSSSGGFYRTVEKEPFNILRLKDGMDTTLPATNGVAVSNLFRLGAMLDDKEYTHLARETIHAFEVEMLQHSWLFPTLLTQVVAASLGGKQLASTAPAPSADDSLVAAFFKKPRAGLRTLVYSKPPSEAGLAWLQKRNPKLASLPTEGTGEGYALDNKGSWQKATADDLVVKVESGQE